MFMCLTGISLNFNVCITVAVMKGIWVSSASVCNRVMWTLPSKCWRPVGLTTARRCAVGMAPVSVASVCVKANTVVITASVMPIVVNTIMASPVMVSTVEWHKDSALICLFLSFVFKTHYLLLCVIIIGKGICDCGQCKCKEDYTGSACECSPSQDKCMNDMGLCSGQGKCTCNRCDCNPGFMGDHCSTLINACMVFK